MKECLLSARHRDGIEHTVHGPDELDAGALRRHLRVALAAGVAGFLAPAMASEVDKLTPAERDLFVGTVLEEARGRDVVIGGASAATSAERVRLARRLVVASSFL